MPTNGSPSREVTGASDRIKALLKKIYNNYYRRAFITSFIYHKHRNLALQGLTSVAPY